MRKITTIVIATIIAAALSACGDKAAEKATDKQPAAGKPNLADVTSGKNAAAIKDAVVQAALPKADKNTPAESYVELNSGNQLMFAYLGLMNTPPDYKDIADQYSKDYSRSSDEFKKNDLLNALKPRIDTEIAKAKTSRYVKLSLDRPVEKFDFEKKAFPLNSSLWDSSSYRYFSDNSNYKLSFSNGDVFRFLKTPTEEEARKIEGLRAQYRDLQLVVYAFVQDANPSARSIRAEIVKVVLLDNKGNVLATQ
jgi:hypothetical protein